jgi:DNA-binding NarL/FixJ family response regulator
MTRRPPEPGFTSRDRRVLELLLPHFVLGLRNAECATRVGDRDASLSAPTDLTPREAQIAHLLALGRTNREIATVLRARIRTVEKHVENILDKFGAPNRTAAAVMFADLEKS